MSYEFLLNFNMSVYFKKFLKFYLMISIVVSNYKNFKFHQ